MDGGMQTEDQSLYPRPIVATMQTPATGSDPRLAWSRHAPKSQ